VVFPGGKANGEEEKRKNPVMEDSAKVGKKKKFLEKIGVHLHPKFYLVLAIAGVGFIVLFAGLFFYSLSPSFCNSCHIMKPYYKAWKESKHHEVACVTCHLPPQAQAALWAKFQAINHVVAVATKRYSSKPYAQIDDASCLREGCHATNILAKKITYKRGIRFDHRFHLGDLRRGKQLRCTSCHSQIVVGTHIEVTDSTCFFCHFKHAEGQEKTLPLGDCVTCHDPPTKKIAFQGFTFSHQDFVGARHVACEKCHLDVIQGKGEAPKDRCYNCHNQPERLDKYEDITFMHETHVAKRKVDCARCHLEIKHGLKTSKTRFMEFNCQACHSAIHNGPKEMFMGEGGRGAPPTPSHMFTVRLDCVACHVQPKSSTGETELGQTLVASEKTCLGCHPNQYRGMLRDWQETFNTMIKDIEPKLKTAQQLTEAKKKDDAKSREAKKLFEDARHNVNFVKVGKGVHNPFYASELIQVADRNLDRLFRLLEKTPPDLPAQSPIRGGYCAKLCHGKAGVKFPPKTSLKGAEVPHALHAYDFGMGCTTCHSAEKHKEIKITKKDCMACHHSPENTRCSRCHQEQTGLFMAKNLPVEIPGAKPSVKAGKVECTNCHDLAKKQTFENITTACVQCHDAAYVDLLKGLRADILEIQKKTKDLLDQADKKLRNARKQNREIVQPAALLERAKKTYDFVTLGKAAHNFDLASLLLEQGQKDARKAMELLPPP